MALVECKNVSVNYGSFEACKDVSFSIEKGDYLCFAKEEPNSKKIIQIALVKVDGKRIMPNRLYNVNLEESEKTEYDKKRVA